MNKAGLIFIAIFSVGSLVCLSLAAGTIFWFGVRHLDGDDAVLNYTKGFQEPEYRFTFFTGLWMTCYDKETPAKVRREASLRGNCTIDYDFPTREIEDFSRASIVCIMLSIAVTILGCLTAVTGIVAKNRSALFHSGLLYFASAVCSLIGNCTFTARILLQFDASVLPPNVTEEFGWSYILSWASLGAQVISGSILVKCGRTYEDKE
uniref:transmembrane protein 178B-like n=1 Tax=Styela clava TaxID=7725 RepID=UPI00193A59FF|nr:transmembrane protein 178B-like [Styela clava]